MTASRPWLRWLLWRSRWRCVLWGHRWSYRRPIDTGSGSGITELHCDRCGLSAGFFLGGMRI